MQSESGKVVEQSKAEGSPSEPSCSLTQYSRLHRALITLLETRSRIKVRFYCVRPRCDDGDLMLWIWRWGGHPSASTAGGASKAADDNVRDGHEANEDGGDATARKNAAAAAAARANAVTAGAIAFPGYRQSWTCLRLVPRRVRPPAP
eukprot:1194423-Prorocentrum_minimum.AAC.7